MEIPIGALLVALVLYTSVLSFVLRLYSRSRLASILPEQKQRTWLERLDRNESELQVLASFVRLSALVALAIVIWDNLAVTSGPWWNLLGLPLLEILILLVFAIGVPNAIARYSGEAWLAWSLPVLWGLRFVLYPVIALLMGVEFIVRRLLGKSETTAELEARRMEQEILDAVTEGKLHGAVDEEQQEIIESVFELHETRVAEIMTPRTDIIAISVDSTADEVRNTIIEAGHSRIPVFEESLDEIIGVLYAKDLLQLNGHPLDIRKLMRAVPYVPETKTIDHLLREFRTGKVHLAIVLDEYGGTAGLVTIEDILEELVGEIDDEYDPRTPETIHRIDPDTLEVDARVHVHEINEELEVTLPESPDYETIGGFVFSSLGKIPAAGEEFRHENIVFRVVDAEPRKINRVQIHVDRETPSRASA